MTVQQLDRPLRRNRRTNVRLEPAGLTRLFEADPDLLESVDADKRELVSRLVAESLVLRPGTWRPEAEQEVDAEAFGLLVLTGLLARGASLGRGRSIELLGSGDLVRPGQLPTDAYAVVRQAAVWHVLAEVRVAVIDTALVRRLAASGTVLGALAGRAIDRSRHLAVRLAIAQLPSLEDRLQLLLWHLADRWGRREHDAVVLPLRLPQDLLADLVAANRTSVNAALGRLTASGTISPRAGGHWVLLEAPPSRLVGCDAA